MVLNYEFNHILGIYEKSICNSNVKYLKEIWDDYARERQVTKIRDKIDFYIYMQMHNKWESIN